MYLSDLNGFYRLLICDRTRRVPGGAAIRKVAAAAMAVATVAAMSGCDSWPSLQTLSLQGGAGGQGGSAKTAAGAGVLVKGVSVEGFSKQMIEASAGTAGKVVTRNVVPSRQAPERLQVVIEDERYLGDVARQLGVSVDAMMRLNNLADTLLKPGATLQVDTTRDQLERFVDRRERRKAAKIAAEEAKRQEKVRLEAEARAARRAKALAARARKRGVPVALAADGKTPDLSQVPGSPLRPGQIRNHGAGVVRGVALPASFGQGPK